MSLSSTPLIEHSVPLCRYSSFQIGGPARYFVQPQDREELVAVLEFQETHQIPFVVIGRGSNMLFADEGFDGMVICLEKFEKERFALTPGEHIKVSAGVGLFRLSAYCQKEGVGGLEFLCHIPGTVGGAIWMNAGFGRPGRPRLEVKDALESITVLDRRREVRVLNGAQIPFKYRSSHLSSVLILDATFRIKNSTTARVREEIRANFLYRNTVQDLRYPSAGSVFKNPTKQASPWTSGQLVEKVGLKGATVGGAMISPRHGNYILNVNQAKASDVLALIEMIKARVYETFQVMLEPEVKIIPAKPETEPVNAEILV